MASKSELRQLEDQMDTAASYEDWLSAAHDHDALTGKAEWRQEEPSELYDHAQIRYRLDRLRKFRKQKDWTGLLYALNEGIHGNMGGMGKSVLYRQAKSGTKVLVEQYIQEIDDALRLLAELPDEVIPTQQKLDFFYRSNVCYGRSALMLSGGGVLGFLHVGVVSELLRQGLLPRVISGSSAGSIVAAALAAYTGLFALQRELGLRHVQRIWHWLSAVTAGDGDDERYKRFCRGRAEALDLPGHDMTTLPPATLVAGHCRGVRLHVLLGDRPVTPIENPRQVSAYDYPRQYGERAPAFARAGRVELGGTPYLLISGTASIVGHESRHIGDVAAQTHEALDNVAAVMAHADAWDPATGLAALECLKAYIRVPGDATTIQAIAKARAPGVPIALLHAPLCREELLVEFEAQMPLT